MALLSRRLFRGFFVRVRLVAMMLDMEFAGFAGMMVGMQMMAMGHMSVMAPVT